MQQLSRAQAKELLALSTAHGRKKSDLILVEGARAIGTLLDCGKKPRYLVLSRDHFSATGAEFSARLEALALPLFEADSDEFGKLADTEHSQGFLAAVDRSMLSHNSDQALQSAPLLVYLDGVADPGNLGTIIRTCVAFGVGLLAVSPNSADFGNPKVVRATAGQLFSLPLLRVSELDTFFAELESNRVGLYAAAGDAAISLSDLALPERACIVLGAESSGVSETVLRRDPTLFKIKIAPQVESLNVAVAAAIAISRISERMKLI